MSEVSDAERVRSVLAVSGDLQLQGPAYAALPQPVLRHVVLPDGSLLLAAPEAVEVGDLVTVTGTDVTSVPQPDRVRGRVRLRGVVAPWTGPRAQAVVDHLAGVAGEVVEIACLRPVSVELDRRCEDRCGSGWRQVALDAYRAAAPDPLVGDQHRWLPHLQRDHPGALRALAEHAVPGLDPRTDVRALALDRTGLVLRLYASHGHRDLRLPFPAPARCACAVRETFGELLGHTATPRHGHP